MKFFYTCTPHSVAIQGLTLIINEYFISFDYFIMFQICHGDIKLENILVTSWHWVLLSDFASFKPTHLPEDNPADFSYFFDTSRRRTCYIAPERLVLKIKV